MTLRVVALSCLLVAWSPVSGSGQSLSVTASVDLAAPDELAYDSGTSQPEAFTLTVTSCAGALGCRVTIENPSTASLIPIDVQWRLTLVSHMGGGTPDCVAESPLLAWQDLPLTPLAVMDTGMITEPGTGCLAGIEVRAVNLSYDEHLHTSPATTYWREIRFRAAEK